MKKLVVGIAFVLSSVCLSDNNPAPIANSAYFYVSQQQTLGLLSPSQKVLTQTISQTGVAGEVADGGNISVFTSRTSGLNLSQPEGQYQGRTNQWLGLRLTLKKKIAALPGLKALAIIDAKGATVGEAHLLYHDTYSDSIYGAEEISQFKNDLARGLGDRFLFAKIGRGEVFAEAEIARLATVARLSTSEMSLILKPSIAISPRLRAIVAKSRLVAMFGEEEPAIPTAAVLAAFKTGDLKPSVSALVPCVITGSNTYCSFGENQNVKVKAIFESGAIATELNFSVNRPRE